MDINYIAEAYLSSVKGKKLADKRDMIASAAESAEGKKIMELLQKTDMESAIRIGDTDELKRIFLNVLSTDEGKKLYIRLKDIIK